MIAISTQTCVQYNYDYDCIAEHTNKFTVIACKIAYMFNIVGMFIVQSQKSVNQNATKEARRQGMISGYLNFTAITIGLGCGMLAYWNDRWN